MLRKATRKERKSKPRIPRERFFLEGGGGSFVLGEVPTKRRSRSSPRIHALDELKYDFLHGSVRVGRFDERSAARALLDNPPSQPKQEEKGTAQDQSKRWRNVSFFFFFCHNNTLVMLKTKERQGKEQTQNERLQQAQRGRC